MAFQIEGYGLAQDQMTRGEEDYSNHIRYKKGSMSMIAIKCYILMGYIFQPTSVVIMTKNINRFRIFNPLNTKTYPGPQNKSLISRAA